MAEVLVAGAGSWGTAFASYLAGHLFPVRIWAREDEVFRSINSHRVNQVFLPGITLSPELKAVTDLETEAAKCEILVLAVPSKYFRSILMRVKDVLPSGVKIVNLSKGFETESLATLSQVAEEVLAPFDRDHWLTLSGPSFARELAQDHPTAMVAASHSCLLQKEVQNLFSSRVLRVYRNSDVLGVEVGAALKNVMAIASGMAFGLGYGYNTTASLITRGSVEISRLGILLGAQKKTFWGLAGIGDLMLTCFSPLSRNFQLGEKIASGKKLQDAENETPMVAEGVDTCKAAREMGRRFSLELPIIEAVYRVLFESAEPAAILDELMTRSLKKE